MPIDDNSQYNAIGLTIASNDAGVSKRYLPGDVVHGTYQLVRLLGRGGMGSVYACKHMVMDKPCALKILTRGFLNSEAWVRFQAEGQALARLNHPGIVRIYDMGIDGEQFPYLVMELLSGDSLDARLKRSGCLSIGGALDLCIQVTEALGSAHQKGIIHRDVKPSNLMLISDEDNQTIQVKLVDFGIARLSKTSFANQIQTATGLVFGTPSYMSPEQCEGLKVDQRSDIYSLGCTLFEALTSKPPFTADTVFQTLMMHLGEPPPSLKSMVPNQDFPASLEMALQKMLSKNADSRYQTMEQVKHDLERIRDGRPIMAMSGNTVAPQTNHTDSSQTDSQNVEFIDEDEPEKADYLSRLGGISGKLIVGIVSGAIITLALLTFVYLKHHSPQMQTKNLPASATTGGTSKESLSLSASKKTQSVQDPKLAEGDGFDRLLMTKIERYQPREIGGLVPVEELKQLGATDDEVERVRSSTFWITFTKEREFTKLLKKYPNIIKWTRLVMKENKQFLVFSFPTDIIIGFIKINQDLPKLAKEVVQVDTGNKVCLYLGHQTYKIPEILDHFGDSDLTGLEVVFSHPAAAIAKIKNWKRLEELSFFNSLIKAMPGHEEYDESALTEKQLPSINQFIGLKSLGLCGTLLSGDGVARMSILKELTVLKLKRIKNVEPALIALAQCNRLKEIWLVAEDTDNKQLKLLTHVKNLETLRIRRSKLSPDSLAIFCRMPALKHLYLDKNNWSKSDQTKFKEKIPGCQFEPVADTRYWGIL